ncbi:hypothetical protein BDV95DRAFT_591466 [Massariosphaeria phaeospora]|uniref:Uncharacterized protein n=1 Tax=Massariosphaeria phaeospora TaxID=100035 RepID=A0A7C8MGC0_9PLEO|nr:hypothetical protein BDV95DRAFT_591466 [Massariosphaeria phaeospora]
MQTVLPAVTPMPRTPYVAQLRPAGVPLSSPRTPRRGGARRARPATDTTGGRPSNAPAAAASRGTRTSGRLRGLAPEIRPAVRLRLLLRAPAPVPTQAVLVQAAPVVHARVPARVPAPSHVPQPTQPRKRRRRDDSEEDAEEDQGRRIRRRIDGPESGEQGCCHPREASQGQALPSPSSSPTLGGGESSTHNVPPAGHRQDGLAHNEQHLLGPGLPESTPSQQTRHTLASSQASTERTSVDSEDLAHTGTATKSESLDEDTVMGEEPLFEENEETLADPDFKAAAGDKTLLQA